MSSDGLRHRAALLAVKAGIFISGDASGRGDAQIEWVPGHATFLFSARRDFTSVISSLRIIGESKRLEHMFYVPRRGLREGGEPSARFNRSLGRRKAQMTRLSDAGEVRTRVSRGRGGPAWHREPLVCFK